MIHGGFALRGVDFIPIPVLVPQDVVVVHFEGEEFGLGEFDEHFQGATAGFSPKG